VALESVERALARLYTDAALRERFYAAPEPTAAELGLDAADLGRVLAVDRERVELFAESLVAKRFGEVRQLLPRALAAFGEAALGERFAAFARDFLPEGVHKHRADALAFAAALEGDAARFDLAVLSLFHRLEGRAARPRPGPAVAFARLGARRVLLVRGRRSSRYRTVRLP
jgi:hypothetical protein